MKWIRFKFEVKMWFKIHILRQKWKTLIDTTVTIPAGKAVVIPIKPHGEREMTIIDEEG